MSAATDVVSSDAIGTALAPMLPSAGVLTKTGWLLPDTLTEDEWKAAGATLSQAEGALQWWLGDWWAFGEAKWGDKRALVESDDWTGPAYQTCVNAANVARKFPVESNRRRLLPFSHHAEVAALPPERADELLDWAEETGASRNALRARVSHNHRAQGTGENEWYTPGEYIEAAREVLGVIDLDPASSDIAQRTVRARSYLTLEDDALTQPWHGRVWLNPPYAQPAIQQFIEKLCESYRLGAVKQAVLLTHNYTDTTWFHIAARHASAICFTRGRISFLSPEGERAAPTQGQAFFYFGPDARRFADVFHRFGFIVNVVDTERGVDVVDILDEERTPA